jgi:MFS family permease
LRNRWAILAILFTVRLTMGFQFQSVAAVAPLLRTQFGVGLAEIGFLIGLYFTPGLVLALPGGAIGQRLGDRRTTLAALLLMLIGSTVMAFGESWSAQVAGRLIAGAGGVLLNVQMTKMVADWFAGKEIATAMAIFVNSWPAGVALSLLILPSIGTAYGVAAVDVFVVALVVIGIALATTYRPPEGLAAATTQSVRPDAKTVLAVIVAGLIWGLFNVGFAAVFSFGPTMLVERGWTIAQAGSVISIVLWLAVISVPTGGLVADRLKRPQAVLIVGSVISTALMLSLAHTDMVVATVIALGLSSGLPAGPIMSLPARVLQPQTRAIGMGIFYTVYYVAMALGPLIAGAAAKSTGSAASAFDFGALMMLTCPLLLLGFNAIAAGRKAS